MHCFEWDRPKLLQLETLRLSVNKHFDPIVPPSMLLPVTPTQPDFFSSRLQVAVPASNFSTFVPLHPTVQVPLPSAASLKLALQACQEALKGRQCAVSSVGVHDALNREHRRCLILKYTNSATLGAARRWCERKITPTVQLFALQSYKLITYLSECCFQHGVIQIPLGGQIIAMLMLLSWHFLCLSYWGMGSLSDIVHFVIFYPEVWLAKPNCHRCTEAQEHPVVWAEGTMISLICEGFVLFFLPVWDLSDYFVF